MDARKLARFDHARTLLACPVCASPLERQETSLVCDKGHRFDIARQGYANLLRGGVKTDTTTYDRASFENRRRVFASGLYEPIAEAVCGIVEELAPRRAVVDAGCGEGYFARHLRTRCAAPICAFDISRDSVQIAARTDAEDGIVWLVADLAAIPVQGGAADVALDIFSPANYREFRRILAPQGHVVKVVPTEHHLHELREHAQAQLEHEGYSNQRVLDHFAASLTVLERHRVTSTLALGDETRQALIAMTPLLSHVDTAAIDWSDLGEVTVEADVLVGTFAQG